MTARRIIAVAVLAALLSAAGVAVWRSMREARPDAVSEVATGLRCPSCEGESVADSRSPVAAAMRAAIAEQLAAGRSPDQVRDWFTQRYGPEVLADPPWRGVGALLWILPATALAAGLMLAARTVRRRREEVTTSADPPRVRPAVARRTWYAVSLAVVGLVTAVGFAAARTGPAPAGPPADPVAERLDLARQLEQRGDFTAAAEAYRSASSLHPDPQIRVREAFALLRASQPAEAAQVAQAVLADRPNDADALLVLGLAQWTTRAPAASQTLRRFLHLAPEHPATAEIRRLVDESPQPER